MRGDRVTVGLVLDQCAAEGIAGLRVHGLEIPLLDLVRVTLRGDYLPCLLDVLAREEDQDASKNGDRDGAPSLDVRGIEAHAGSLTDGLGTSPGDRLVQMTEEDGDLRILLETLDPKARDDLRRVLIQHEADRDAISSRLMRYGDRNGDDWADSIDMLTMHPEARRKVARLLGEIDAG